MTQTAITPGHSHSLKIPALRPVSSRPVATDWKKISIIYQTASLISPEMEGLNVEVMEGKACVRLVQGGRGGCQEQSCQPATIFNRNSSSLWDTTFINRVQNPALKHINWMIEMWPTPTATASTHSSRIVVSACTVQTLHSSIIKTWLLPLVTTKVNVCFLALL